MEAKVYKVAIGTESFSSTVDFAVENPDIGSTVTSGWRNSSLHVATIGGNKVFIENILQYSDVFTTNSKGETALHIAARLGHVEVATCLIEHVESLPRQEEDPDWLTMVNQEGNTALHEAVRYGHFAMVELLIRKRPLLASSTNGDGESPLFMAVDRKFYRIARHILEKFPNCSDSGRNGMNVMHAAVIRLHYISFRFYSLVQSKFP
ncbi:Transmembrane protein [Trema orientale]|uniref:Transmembrane protein n=1 Tax=Trema orientale TaxID=63057 RepID=A0A2P5ECF8_TREOI|nr:Transmembrane protein [Trema orientale]